MTKPKLSRPRRLLIAVLLLRRRPRRGDRGRPGQAGRTSRAGPRGAAPPRQGRSALQDILAWKSIGAAELSPDGSWFMYQLSPARGRERGRPPSDGRDQGAPLPHRRGAALRRVRPAGLLGRLQVGRLPVLPRDSKETKSLRKDRKRIHDDGRPGRPGHGRKDGIRKGPRPAPSRARTPASSPSNATRPRARRRRRTSGPVPTSSCASWPRAKRSTSATSPNTPSTRTGAAGPAHRRPGPGRQRPPAPRHGHGRGRLPRQRQGRLQVAWPGRRRAKPWPSSRAKRTRPTRTSSGASSAFDGFRRPQGPAGRSSTIRPPTSPSRKG